jgi:hypothetical protein
MQCQYCGAVGILEGDERLCANNLNLEGFVKVKI